MDFPQPDKRKGTALVVEAIGTCILVSAYCVNLHQDDVLLNSNAPFYFALPAIYFVLLTMLLRLSGA